MATTPRVAGVSAGGQVLHGTIEAYCTVDQAEVPHSVTVIPQTGRARVTLALSCTGCGTTSALSPWYGANPDAE